MRFAAAVVGDDVNELNAARDLVEQTLGSDALVSASIIAGTFSMLDRAANAIGIFVDPMIVKPSESFRETLGINRYPSAANTLGNTP